MESPHRPDVSPDRPLDAVDDETVVALGFAPWDGRRVPVTLLGGYLGAGKTTVLNELLARTDRPIAVLVNDLGAVGVDAALVRRRHADTIDLSDGCVCCSTSSGLVAALDTLRARPEPPDHVVVELSGVAEPARVVPWVDGPGLRLDGIVVLVDCERFVDLVDDPHVGASVRAQVEAADLVVLTKLDLVSPERAEATRAGVADLAPGVPVFAAGEVTHSAGLLSLGTRRPGGVADLPPPTLFDAHVATSVALPRPVTDDELATIVADLPDDTLRAKGVALAPDGSHRLVQVVGRRREITALPAAEDQEATDLVVIRPRRPHDGPVPAVVRPPVFLP